MFEAPQKSAVSAERMFDQNLIVGLIVLAVVVLAIYAYAPKVRAMLSGMRMEGFQDAKKKRCCADRCTEGRDDGLW